MLWKTMRRTFPNRWDAYVNNKEPSTLLEYLSQYPLLKKASFVSIHYNRSNKKVHVMCTITVGMCTYATAICNYIFIYILQAEFGLYLVTQQAAQEFALVCKREGIHDSSQEKLPTWAKAVALYCKKTQIKSSALQAETLQYSDTMDDDMFYLPYIYYMHMMNYCFYLRLYCRYGITLLIIAVFSNEDKKAGRGHSIHS